MLALLSSAPEKPKTRLLVVLANSFLIYLSYTRFGDTLGEDDLVRHAIFGDGAVFHKGHEKSFEFLFRDLTLISFPQDHIDNRPFRPLNIGYADGRSFTHCLVLRDYILQSQ